MNKKAICEAAALAAIAKNKDASEAALTQRTAQIYAACPEIAALNSEMEKNMNGLMATFYDKQSDPESFEGYRERAKQLRQKRKELLVAAGYDEDALSVKYVCPACKDTGVIGEEVCSCYKKALSNEYLKASNLSPDKKATTFSKFDLSYYKGADGERMEKYLAFCKKYVKNFAQGKENLLFAGTPGSGKTFLSCAIGFELIEKGRFVIYTPIQEMISAFESAQFQKDSEVDTSIYTDSDLLIIDDLGAEFKTPFADTVLYNVINTRINRKKPFIISTNFTPDEINDRYHDRITSRLIYETVNMPFPDVDIRIEKRKRR